MRSRFVGLFALMLLSASVTPAESPQGYYRQPAIHGEIIVFVAEGDLWRVPATGGTALRITTHHGSESDPAISPDGATLAFTAQYEGPAEIYTMPLNGGRPTRRTYDAWRGSVQGFTPDGTLLFATRQYSTLPDAQLVLLGLNDNHIEHIPLSQAAEGAFDGAGVLYFTRFRRQSSHTKRYRGGTAQSIWRFDNTGDNEAVPLTADYAGTSRGPMFFNGRVYFETDRDGSMNIWSMLGDGSDPRQHTFHQGWDVQSPSLGQGRIVYQLGADIHLLDLASGEERRIPIQLSTDFDQTREKWIDDPMSYLTSAHLSPDGDRIVLTARGEVFVAPHRQGRLVHVTRAPDVRYRDARFMPDSKTLLALSDESGEVELWTLPADGMDDGIERTQLTSDGKILRWAAVPSPDGRWIAHHDKDWQLWLYDVQDGTQRMIDESGHDRFHHMRWSPDSRWLAYVKEAPNENAQIRVHDTSAGMSVDLTTDRYVSSNPSWSPDGQWLYFLSERHLSSLVRSPWGPNQPEPFFDRRALVFAISLQDGLRSPFAPDDELSEEEDSGKTNGNGEEAAEDGADEEQEEDNNESGDEPEPIQIDLDGIQARLHAVPIPPGNYSNLFVTEKHLYWLARDDNLHKSDRHLKALKIDNSEVEVKTIVAAVSSAELSADRKKILIRKGNNLHIIDADGSEAGKLDKKQVDLSRWSFPLIPQEEWRQMFVEAWRLERDYFYDRDMHGVDWSAILQKYLPLVDRVSDRDELSDLVAQMVSELSALHIFVYGGDVRRGSESISPASLGAELRRDDASGGYIIDHIYQSDPDEPQRRSPLARLDLNIKEGHVITMINGVPLLEANHASELLRNQAGRQVRLRIKSGEGGEMQDVIVTPISARAAADLRYHEWEYSRRLKVEELGDGEIGYVHLRAMSTADIAQWTRHFYPVFKRKGLILDVRHNGGGNIDSWVLEKLMRKAWFYWQGRVGEPTWNMQYAFRGHLVILCDERTGSDGEAITEGVRRLGLGTIIGTRTWGGEIWLTSSNRLVDQGIATAAEFGVYGPDGAWLIEGHGVDPDIVIDNLPHATFNGADAQLQAAIDHLLKRIAEDPVDVPPAPLHPDKSFGENARD